MKSDRGGLRLECASTIMAASPRFSKRDWVSIGLQIEIIQQHINDKDHTEIVGQVTRLRNARPQLYAWLPKNRTTYVKNVCSAFDGSNQSPNSYFITMKPNQNEMTAVKKALREGGSFEDLVAALRRTHKLTERAAQCAVLRSDVYKAHEAQEPGLCRFDCHRFIQF